MKTYFFTSLFSRRLFFGVIRPVISKCQLSLHAVNAAKCHNMPISDLQP